MINKLWGSVELTPENYPGVGVGSCPTTGGKVRVRVKAQGQG